MRIEAAGSVDPITYLIVSDQAHVRVRESVGEPGRQMDFGAAEPKTNGEMPRGEEAPSRSGIAPLPPMCGFVPSATRTRSLAPLRLDARLRSSSGIAPSN